MLLLVVAAVLGTACAGQSQVVPQVDGRGAVDSVRALSDLEFLASPALEGRGAGTRGGEAARAYLLDRFRESGVEPAFGGEWTQSFPLPGIVSSAHGVNVVGLVRGTDRPESYLVVTAHYDHLGVRNGTIYPGADDNASGTAALLELARILAVEPPRHSIVLAALDAEELGLLGARAFVAAPPVPVAAIALNVNLDMVGRSDRGELYVAGPYHTPVLRTLVDEVAARSRLQLRIGHDRPDLPAGQDWTMSSDHGAFHEVGIPFAYFGVEDHADYHEPTDTFENIDQTFFVEAVRTVLDFVRVADRRLADVERARR